MLSAEEEALIVAFRKHALLPLGDYLYALQATVPHLTRSSPHRLFQRHGVSRLPTLEGEKPRKMFKDYGQSPLAKYIEWSRLAGGAKRGVRSLYRHNLSRPPI